MDGALAEEVDSRYTFVTSYIRFLLGNVIKCRNIDELRPQSIGVTPDCMLYHGYRLTHPDQEQEEEQMSRQNNAPADGVRYVPPAEPYRVHIRWENSALSTIGEPQEAGRLDWDFMKLMLSPFHAMEVRKRQKKDPDNGQKGR